MTKPALIKSLVILGACLLIAGGLYFGIKGSVPFSKAVSGDNVSGWAYSENIGYISFNCTDASCPPNYGVNVDSNGYFSGYAVANPRDETAGTDNIGYLSFEPGDVASCPSGQCRAQILGNNWVTGWARFIVGKNNPGQGWEGWVKLGDGTGTWPAGGEQVHLNQDTCELEGWAWGGDEENNEAVVGWISFNSKTDGSGVDYAVKIDPAFCNQPPVANFTWDPETPTTDDIIQFTDLSTDADGFIVSWSWNFNDGTTCPPDCGIGTQQNPTHQYTDPGDYSATLTVTDNDGLTASITKSLTAELPLPGYQEVPPR